MALHMPVQKDIGEYEEKIVGKMTLRTIVCLALGFGSAIAAGALLRFGLGLDASALALPIMLCSMPFWLAGFWRPLGMRAEEFAPLLWAHATNEQRLAYAPCLAQGVPERPVEPGRPGRKSIKKARRKGAELREPSKEQEG